MDRSHLPKKSIKVKQDCKFSSRHCIFGEMSATNSSVEVYYGGASVAVPFTWESQPGTPKVKFRENPLPPLTPPPSFQSSSVKTPQKKHSKPNIFHAVLPKLNLRKTSHPPSPALSSSPPPPPSSRSVPSSPFNPKMRGRFQLSSPRSSFDSGIDREDECGSPVSTLCFGIGRGANVGSRGRSSNVTKVLLREFA